MCAKAVILLFLLFTWACGYDPNEYAKSVVRRNARSRNVGSEINIRAIARALEDYYAENDGYPVGSDATALATALSPDLMHVVPQRDAWGFRYVYESDGRSYRLSSVGQDGKLGTADDIVMFNTNR